MNMEGILEKTIIIWKWVEIEELLSSYPPGVESLAMALTIMLPIKLWKDGNIMANAIVLPISSKFDILQT